MFKPSLKHVPSILQLIKQNPVMRCSDIARQVKISRQAVWQILNSTGNLTRKRNMIITKTCPICGTVMTGTKSQLNKTCSPECARDRSCLSTKVILTCPTCKTQFARIPSAARRPETNYCSKRCYWLRNYAKKFSGPSGPRGEV